MTEFEKSEQLKAQASAILDAAKALGRENTDEELTKAADLVDEAKAIDARLAKAEALSKSLEGDGATEIAVEAEKAAIAADFSPVAAKSLGDQFVEIVSDELKGFIDGNQTSTHAEVKAAADFNLEGNPTSGAFASLLKAPTSWIYPIDRPFVTGAFAQAATTLPVIPFLVEGELEGTAGATAEAGAKSKVHLADPVLKQVVLVKITAFDKISSELLADLPVVAARVNNRLLYAVALELEREVLNGDGTANTMTGLLQTSGIQVASPAAGSAQEIADAIYAATVAVQQATQLTADTVLINPNDYMTLRLAKNANNDYVGGNYFEGNMTPLVWGLQTVISPAIAVGTIVVGAFRQGATLYSKGGMTIEATNSNEDDFKNNLVALRAETRAVLAVERPAAFVKITLSSEPSIDTITPNPVVRGTMIEVKGHNFKAGATIAIDTTAATNVTYVSANELTATVPAGVTAGDHEVFVIVDGVKSAGYTIAVTAS